MRKRINIILLLICMSISMSACGNKQEKVQKDSNQIVREISEMRALFSFVRKRLDY